MTGHAETIAPAPWIARFAALARPGGAVLDVACGSGRNGRAFLARGHAVVFVDRDTSGLGDLSETPGAETVAADLETGQPVFAGTGALAGRAFDAVVVVNYLHRPLFPALLGAVKPGGVLLYSTFMAGNEAFGKPSNPDFLLHENELLERAGDAHVMAFEQGAVALADGGRAVRQSLAAIRRGRWL